MSRVYKSKPGHKRVDAGKGDLATFFAWALALCKRDEVDRVMVETPDWRVIWTAPKRPLKKRIKQTRTIEAKGRKR